jgi:hypothetical protein
MKLLVELEEDGIVTPEIVRESVELAIRHWQSNVGLSADEDEGQINTIDVTIVEEQ